MQRKTVRPRWWISTLYLTDALPYVVLTLLSLVVYKRFGLPHTFITSAGSFILLPWICKPWILRSRRLQANPKYWHLLAQAITGLSLIGIAHFLTSPWQVEMSILFFFLISCCYTVQDGCKNFLYNSMEPSRQKHYLRLRTTASRVGLIFCAGVLIMLAGGLETRSGHIRSSWSMVFYILATLFLITLITHELLLPNPAKKVKYRASKWQSFKALCMKPGATALLIFTLIYRLPQALLMRITPLFLLDPVSRGGAGLSTQELGLALGTIGFIALATGSVIGHQHLQERGLDRCMLNMRLSMCLPVIGYLFITLTGFHHFALVSLIIFIDQFCYGYGFTGCLYSVKKFTEGNREDYTWSSVFLTIGLILPGFLSGLLQEQLGYTGFFILVLLTGFIPLRKFIP